VCFVRIYRETFRVAPLGPQRAGAINTTLLSRTGPAISGLIVSLASSASSSAPSTGRWAEPLQLEQRLRSEMHSTLRPAPVKPRSALSEAGYRSVAVRVLRSQRCRP
jgi:hypothetical protein